jgi:response regulator of citrate/malate metabolism
MMNFLKSRKMDQEKLDSVSELEKIREIEKEKSVNQRLESIIFQKFKEAGLEDKINEMNSRLEEVAGKMDELMFLYQSNSRGKTNPSVRKLKVKEIVNLLIQQHGMLSAPQLSDMMNLSRTRCSEYLKEMELNGVLVSELKCRKKFYQIRQ